MSKNDYYLGIALAVSKRSTCLKRRYGAVIVNNDEIISTGYNGNPRGEENCCDRGDCKRMNLPSNSGNYNDCFSVHAEQNAMISASRKSSAQYASIVVPPSNPGFPEMPKIALRIMTAATVTPAVNNTSKNATFLLPTENSPCTRFSLKNLSNMRPPPDLPDHSHI